MMVKERYKLELRKLLKWEVRVVKIYHNPITYDIWLDGLRCRVSKMKWISLFKSLGLQ